MMSRILFTLALGLGLTVSAHAADPAAGKQLVTDKGCVACHGANGDAPTTPDNPKLAGQHADYLMKALSDYKNGRRKNPIMAGMAANLSAQEIEDLAEFFSTQNGLSVK
jgi:cytochrome c553